VHSQQAASYRCSNWQVVKELRKALPNRRATEFAQALSIKAIHLRDLTTLMVSPQERDPLRMVQLQKRQQRDGLH